MMRLALVAASLIGLRVIRWHRKRQRDIAEGSRIGECFVYDRGARP